MGKVGKRLWLAFKIASGTVLALILAVALVLYLDLSVTRRFVTRIANSALAPVFRGRLIIEHLGKLRHDGIDGTRVRVLDPAGHAVFVVDGLHARIVTMKLIRGLLASPSRVDIDIPEASIDHVDFALDTDDGGTPLVAAAFTPVPPAPSSAPSSPGPAVDLVISHARIAHAWVHGTPTWAPPLDTELTDVEAKVTVRDGKVEVDVKRGSLGARGLPIGENVKGNLHGRVLVPSEHGNAVGLDASFRGTFAGIDHAAHFTMDGPLLSGELDLEGVTPEKVRPFVPAYPLQDVLSVHAGARGTFPVLDVDLRAVLRGGGSLVASGQTTLSTKKTASVHAKLAAIDLRGMGPGLPASSLGAGVDATIAVDAEGAVTGEASVVSLGGTVGSQVLPTADVQATFAHGARFGNRAEATVTLRDPGLTGRAALRLSPKGKSYELAFDARAEAPRLEAIQRLELPVQGSLRVSAEGKLSFDTLVVAGDAEAEAHDLEPRARGSGQPSFAVKAAAMKAHVAGSIFLPSVDAKVHADSLDLMGVHSDTADVTVTGVVTAPHVHATLAGGDAPDLDADTDLQIGATTLLRNLRVALSRQKDAVEVRADPVRISADTVSADRITLGGVGGVGGIGHGQFKLAPHVLQVIAESPGVDLAELSRIAGVSAWCQSGQLAFNVDATIRGSQAEGHGTVDVTGASVKGVQGATAHADLVLHDEHIGGHLHAELGDIGTADLVATKVQVGKEGAASLHAWERVWGALEFNANVDLGRLDAVLPKGDVPFGAMSGRLEVAAKMKRRSITDDTPQLDFTVKTAQLVVLGKPRLAPAPAPAAPLPASPRVRGEEDVTTASHAGTAATLPPSWRIEGVDLAMDGRIEAETGFAELAGRLTDAKGPIVALDMKSAAMPYSALMASPGNAKALLSKVAFEANIVVPKRDLATLPPALELQGAEGVLEANLDVKGTLDDPTVDLKARLGEVAESSARISLPVDLELTSHYAGGKADATLTGQSEKRGEVLHAEAHVEGRLRDIAFGSPDAPWPGGVGGIPPPRAEGVGGIPPPWTAGGYAHLERFPLGAVGFLEDRQVRGHVSGDVVLKDLHKDASATADVVVDGLEIGSVKYTAARLHAALDGHAADVTAHLDHGDGSADAHAHAGETWGAALFPHVVDKDPVDVSVTTKQLRAETFLPFAHDTLAELEGRITGNAHLGFDPREGKPKLDGKLVLEHGKFEFGSALGEFHDATATLVLTPDGLATLENATASGVTGKVEAAASARIIMDETNGLSLGSARATLRIPSKGSVPVIIEGTPFGSIDGAITMSEDPLPGGKGIKIGVEIPTLHVALPQSGTRDVQGLGDIQDARIQARRGTEEVVIPLGPPGEERARAADAKRIELTVHLGDDVKIRRGTTLKVGLTGQLAVTITDKARVSGQLQLTKGGVLDVQGKSFEIESGTVSFVGDDPSNPQVVVTAGWTANDGTRVFADYIGPLRTGKVTLRSQPSFSQSDIVALLVFGTAEGSSGAAGQATNTATNTAAGLAANSVATAPINRALDQFGLQRVSARIDTSQGANPKPEVEVKIAKNISVQIAQVLGVPPPGANPDTTLLTLNWRFMRNLSLSTTVGNYGSSIVDMVWQRRY